MVEDASRIIKKHLQLPYFIQFISKIIEESSASINTISFLTNPNTRLLIFQLLNVWYNGGRNRNYGNSKNDCPSLITRRKVILSNGSSGNNYYLVN